MNRFSEIYTAFDLYKDRIDKIIWEYRKSQEENRKVYNSETVERLKEEELNRRRAEYRAEQEKIAERVDGILKDVQGVLKRWVGVPVRSEQITLMQALISLGAKLTPTEFEALRDSVGDSYFGWKLLEKVAISSGLKGFRSPYRLELYTNMLKDVKNGADIFISSYVGAGADYCAELLNLEKHPNSKTLSYAAASARILSANSSLTAAALVWDGDHLPTSGKFKLTKDELEAVDKMFEDCSTDEARRAKGVQITKDMPLLGDVIRLSPYGKYLSESNNSEEVKY